MAYISNQRAVLPALRDIMDKQIDENNSGGEGNETETSVSVSK
jgi:hypothetical protein